MSTIVTSGYGQPEEGAIVAGGMGATEPAPPGSISASLSGVGTITATLTATEAAPPTTGGHIAGNWLQFAPIPTVKVVNLSATLTGSSTVDADASSFDWNPLYQLNNAILLELV